MSASAVSITANPAAARRRPVMVNEKKSSNIELLPAEPQVNGDRNVGDDRVATAANSRDLSHHSIRGEALAEKDLVQVKKSAMTNSTVSPRRTRKAATAKPEKPRWLTVVSIFTKNFVLLVVLLGLAQLVRRLALKNGDSTQLGFSEFERRIAEAEDFVKSTTRLMQVQVEVVDRKIESEIGGLRNEVRKSIEDKGVILELELKKLEEKSKGLEKMLSELRAVDWLSKEEFNRFFEEIRKGKGGQFSENDVSLDDIRVYAREIAEKEIEKHAADGLGRVDYALASGGGSVVKHSDPYLVAKGTNWFLSSTRGGVHIDADKMLKPSFGEPGQCFPLKGSGGFVQIKLRTAIIPEAITLEHVAKSVAYDRSSAPKDCRVSGWLQGHDNDVAISAEKMFLLTEFTYDLEKSSAQTFNVLDLPGLGLVDTVRLDFTSNHGSPSHTCIYRLRVHGHEPDSVSMLPL